jgi:hypothetical protein
VTKVINDSELTPSDDDAEFLEEISDDCERSRTLLAPFISEARIPFVSPTQYSRSRSVVELSVA